jgi:cell division protease FtsH
MGALGYVMHVPEDEKYLNSQAELHDMIVGLLGGRAAEEIVFDTVTTGASNDIEKATGIARSMVTRYGMSKRFGLMGLETVESQYLEGRSSMNCADQTAAEVDNEVMSILKECYGEALGLLRENREVMDKIADHLIVKETITGKEFMKIYREAKGLPEPEEKPKEDAKENENNETPTVSLEKPQEPEKEPEQPIWTRPYEPKNNPYYQQPEGWQQPQAEPKSDDGSDKNNGDNNSDSNEYSQFGSAWEQNVNDR